MNCYYCYIFKTGPGAIYAMSIWADAHNWSWVHVHMLIGPLQTSNCSYKLFKLVLDTIYAMNSWASAHNCSWAPAQLLTTTHNCSWAPAQLLTTAHNCSWALAHLLIKVQCCSITRHSYIILASGMSCKFCGKVFSRGFNLRRHENYYCSLKNQEREMSETEFSQTMDFRWPEIKYKSQIHKQQPPWCPSTSGSAYIISYD